MLFRSNTLSKKSIECLTWFMRWGESHVDESGRPQYPSKTTITKTVVVYAKTVDQLARDGYLTFRMADVLYPTPKAQVWWANYKKRPIHRLDNAGER